MPNFYFNVRTSHPVTHHPEPRELPDLRQAMVAAHGLAGALIRKQLRHGAPAPAGSLDIEDERRRPVARIMLAELARQIAPPAG